MPSRNFPPSPPITHWARQGLTMLGKKGPGRGARPHEGVSPRPAAWGAGPAYWTRDSLASFPSPHRCRGLSQRTLERGCLCGDIRTLEQISLEIKHTLRPAAMTSVTEGGPLGSKTWGQIPALSGLMDRGVVSPSPPSATF